MYGLWHGAGATAARRRRTGRAALLISASIALAVSGVVSAVDDLEFQVERIDGDGWRARDLETSIALRAGATIANLRIARLELPGLDRPLRDVRIECAHVEISSDAFACDQAAIRLVGVSPAAQSLRGSVRYGRRTGALEVALRDAPLGEGVASAKLALSGGAWTMALRLNNASIPALAQLARDLGATLPAIDASSGLATLSASARGTGGDVRDAAFEGRLIQLTFNNESGSIASDALALDLRGSLQRAGSRSKFDLELRSSSGQAYAQPIFLDFGVHAASVTLAGTLEGATVTLERFALDHTDVAKAEGAATLNFADGFPLRRLDARIEAIRFPGAYESYLQPMLLDTSFKSMQSQGSLSGRVVFDGGAPQSIELRFSELAFEDAEARFGLSGLGGRWRWRNAMDREQDAVDSPPADLISDLRWDGGVLLGLALGPAKLKFATEGREFRLLERARIPLLDGAVDFETLRARNVGTPKVAFLVDATIQPISVDRLCRAFGWPEFGGRVGGVISKLRMREGVVTLGTTLQAQVFDGAVGISDLRLEQPFGQWPRFYSSIALERLDLELVTRAFSFGRITGRLSGEIRELELFNWTPVAFDARFYTPPDDRTRHRISQRAVENIGSIGGGAGVSAALSSGFLRFFDDFNYDRLGLSCRLENDVCRMSGLAPAPNGGYYLVKGQGLPRIDVIGNSRQVDWPRLVQQLIAVTQSGGPVVR